jgi:hypothetical protein
MDRLNPPIITAIFVPFDFSIGFNDRIIPFRS